MKKLFLLLVVILLIGCERKAITPGNNAVYIEYEEDVPEAPKGKELQ